MEDMTVATTRHRRHLETKGARDCEHEVYSMWTKDGTGLLNPKP